MILKAIQSSCIVLHFNYIYFIVLIISHTEQSMHRILSDGLGESLQEKKSWLRNLFHW